MRRNYFCIVNKRLQNFFLLIQRCHCLQNFAKIQLTWVLVKSFTHFCHSLLSDLTARYKFVILELSRPHAINWKLNRFLVCLGSKPPSQSLLLLLLPFYNSFLRLTQKFRIEEIHKKSSELGTREKSERKIPQGE